MQLDALMRICKYLHFTTPAEALTDHFRVVRLPSHRCAFRSAKLCVWRDRRRIHRHSGTA